MARRKNTAEAFEILYRRSRENVSGKREQAEPAAGSTPEDAPAASERAAEPSPRLPVPRERAGAPIRPRPLLRRPSPSEPVLRPRAGIRSVGRRGLREADGEFAGEDPYSLRYQPRPYAAAPRRPARRPTEEPLYRVRGAAPNDSAQGPARRTPASLPRWLPSRRERDARAEWIPPEADTAPPRRGQPIAGETEALGARDDDAPRGRWEWREMAPPREVPAYREYREYYQGSPAETARPAEGSEPAWTHRQTVYREAEGYIRRVGDIFSAPGGASERELARHDGSAGLRPAGSGPAGFGRARPRIPEDARASRAPSGGFPDGRFGDGAASGTGTSRVDAPSGNRLATGAFLGDPNRIDPTRRDAVPEMAAVHAAAEPAVAYENARAVEAASAAISEAAPMPRMETMTCSETAATEAPATGMSASGTSASPMPPRGMSEAAAVSASAPTVGSSPVQETSGLGPGSSPLREPARDPVRPPAPPPTPGSVAAGPPSSADASVSERPDGRHASVGTALPREPGSAAAPDRSAPTGRSSELDAVPIRPAAPSLRPEAVPPPGHELRAAMIEAARQGTRWVLGDGLSDALARRVELRMGTLVGVVLVTVVIGALLILSAEVRRENQVYNEIFPPRKASPPTTPATRVDPAGADAADGMASVPPPMPLLGPMDAQAPPAPETGVSGRVDPPAPAARAVQPPAPALSDGLAAVDAEQTLAPPPRPTRAADVPPDRRYSWFVRIRGMCYQDEAEDVMKYFSTRLRYACRMEPERRDGNQETREGRPLFAVFLDGLFASESAANKVCDELKRKALADPYEKSYMRNFEGAYAIRRRSGSAP